MITLNFANATRDLTVHDHDAILKHSLNGILVDQDPDVEADGAPVPWDAGVSLTDTDVVLDGGVGPNGFGHCTVRLPKDVAHKVYRFVVEPADAESAMFLGNLFARAGIETEWV